MIKGRRIVSRLAPFRRRGRGIDVAAHAIVGSIALYGEGKTLLFIGFGGELIGIPELRATLLRVWRLRPSPARVRQRVKRADVDRRSPRKRVADLAAALGLDGFHAELMPHDKAAIVELAGRRGQFRIAFVGDGSTTPRRLREPMSHRHASRRRHRAVSPPTSPCSRTIWSALPTPRRSPTRRCVADLAELSHHRLAQ